MSGMRARNERQVLSLIHRHGPLAKADIARLSGLSAQTASVIMRGLEAEGILVKGTPVRGKVGQPSIPMRLADDGAYFLGLKIGRRSMDLVLTNFLGVPLDRLHQPHAFPRPDETLAFVRDGTRTLLDRLPPKSRQRIYGLGIAAPFHLWEWAQALGVAPEALAPWRRRDMRSEVAEHLPFPVYLANDASCACQAEILFGSPGKPANFLYFYLGFFIGGGIVLDGALYTGPTGNAGALGSVLIPDPKGGARQLLDAASLYRLEAMVKAEGGETAPLWREHEAWSVDRAILDRWLDDATLGLAQAIVGATSVVDAGMVLIDGWLPRSLLSRVLERTDAHLAEIRTQGLLPPTLAAGQVGADARAIGAASLPLAIRFLA